MVGWTVRKLKSKNPRVRDKAMNKLVAKSGARVVSSVGKLLNHKRSDVRETAVCTLARLHTSEADEVLMSALCDENENVRRMAADALRRVSDNANLDRIAPSLKDQSPAVRVLAIQVLAGMNDSAVLARIEPLLSDEEAVVKAEAARAFARLGTESERPVFLRLLKDESDSVRQAATMALSRIDKHKHTMSGDIFTGTDYWFRQVKEDRKEPDNESVYRSRSVRPAVPDDEAKKERAAKIRSLIAVLKDADKDIRMAAAQQLGKVGDTSTLAPLSVLLNDPSPEVAEAAKTAIDSVKGVLPPDLGFHGVMRKVGLADVIQLECLNRNSSIIEVRADDHSGRIFIREGAIVHAEIDLIKGTEAFNRVMCLPGGQFVIKDFTDPALDTIEGSWEFLVMEAARLRDEMRLPS